MLTSALASLTLTFSEQHKRAALALKILEPEP
jgi:hypothetical protein